MEDKKLQCTECGKEFIHTVKDQNFFNKNQYSDPKRCLPCRTRRRNIKIKDLRPYEQYESI